MKAARIGLFFGYAPPEKGAPVTRLVSLSNHISQKNYFPVIFAPSRNIPKLDNTTIENTVIRFRDKNQLRSQILESDLDFAIISTPPLDVAVWAADILENISVPYIADFRDPTLTATVYHHGIGPSNWIRILKTWVKEHKLITGSYENTVVSEYLIHQLKRQHLLSSKKFTLSSNGADSILFNLVNYGATSNVRSELNIQDDCSLIIYVGTIEPEFELRFLLKTMSDYKHVVTCKLLIIAVIDNDSMKNSLLQLATKYGIRDRVLFLQNIPIESVCRYIQEADIGVTAIDDRLRYAIQIKLYEYILSGTPVLVKAIKGSALSNLISSHNEIGWSYNSWEELGRNFVKCISESKEKSLNIKNNYQYYRDLFSRDRSNQTFRLILDKGIKANQSN